MAAPIPSNETERLEALRRYDILDTPPEPAYNDLTLLAAYICGTPIALTSLIDADRQWFKARVGLEAMEAPRHLAFCAYAILQPDLLIVPDATKDDRFATNPLVTADPRIRFYAGAPLITADGHSLGTLCVIDHVPRELSLPQEEALRALARQVGILLELRKTTADLQARTAELDAANRRLEGAMQEIAEASRQKSEFLANMSHELRTPLNSILGFAQLLLDQTATLLSDKRRRYLTHIHNSGRHLLQLITDILDLAKVEAGKFDLHSELLPVAETLEDILVIVRGLANKKSHTLVADIAADLPTLRADPVRLKQILFNLLSNAIKFTPEHGQITLTAHRDDAEAEFLEIRVADTGVGVRPEDLPRLFQRFAQLETTQAQRHEGTGLGLALTKQLVEMHGGRIWAESAGVGQGATFTVLLPFAGPEDLREA